jgi:ATP-dependent exoDNAse (exonuclease V) alpha subunit
LYFYSVTSTISPLVDLINCCCLNGLIESAFKKIDKNIYEIPSKIKDKKEGIIKTTASHWINLNEEKRENTLIISPTNKIRQGINNEIRNYLKLENKLQGQEHKLKVLENKSLTKAEKCLATNYEKNDVILFNNEYKKLGIKKDEYLTVKEVKNNNIITLKNKQGREVNLNLTYTVKNLDKAIEVYKQKEIGLQVGDTIKWTKNSKTNPLIINSEKGRVLEIDNKNIIIKTGYDKNLVLSIKKDQSVTKHIDYGYASTVHNSQGKTHTNVIGAIESKHPYLTNQPMFYVIISRAKNEASIITDNKNMLAKNIKNNTGYSISALEHVSNNKMGLNNEENNLAIKQDNNTIKIEAQKMKFGI